MSIHQRDMIRLVKKLRIDNNCVIVIKEGSELATTDVIRSLEMIIGKTNLKNVIILVAKDPENISSFNEVAMQRGGWYRSSIIQKLVGKRDASVVLPPKAIGDA